MLTKDDLNKIGKVVELKTGETFQKIVILRLKKIKNSIKEDFGRMVQKLESKRIVA